MVILIGMDFAPFRFFFAEKSVITLRHSSFIAKGHARLACSLASVLTDGSLPLPPFGDYACGARGNVLTFLIYKKGIRHKKYTDYVKILRNMTLSIEFNFNSSIILNVGLQ